MRTVEVCPFGEGQANPLPESRAGAVIGLYHAAVRSGLKPREAPRQMPPAMRTAQLGERNSRAV